MNMVTLSIAAIIPTFRRQKYARDTVRMLFEQTRVPDEIIVVDQTPAEERDDEPMAELERLDREGRIRLLRQERPRVYEARNRAAAAARCDLLLYLDDDVVLHTGLVESHTRHYGNPEVHAVVGALVGDFYATMRPVDSELHLLPPEVQAYTYKTGYGQPMERIAFMYAGNFSIRKEVLASLGGWDEHVVTYGDRDLGIRLNKAGFRLDYDPQAKLIHLAVPEGGTRLTTKKSPWKSWERCVSIHMLAWRHLDRHPVMFAKYGLWRAAKFSFLLKRNAMDPKTWPRELSGYVKAFFVGWKWARDGVKCSFDLTGISGDKPFD
jgi:GT2 family glycosyltransferase